MQMGSAAVRDLERVNNGITPDMSSSASQGAVAGPERLFDEDTAADPLIGFCLWQSRIY